MNLILEEYLEKINSNMDDYLSSFDKVVKYHDSEEIRMGLLKYKEKPEKNIAFLFIMPEETIQHFHTVGMKFPIKISFWNSKKEVVFTSGIVKPGAEDISSKTPAKYVIEIPM